MAKGSPSRRDRHRVGEHLHEMRFARTQGFFEQSVVIRFLIALAFGVVLFLFFHFRESYIEILELGTNAKKYVVAQVDFTFPDEEATIVLRQEATESLGPIYRIEETEILERTTEFQKYITQVEAGERAWEEVARESGFKELALSLSLLADRLSTSRFTDVQTLHRIELFPAEELPLPISNFTVFLPSGEGQPVRLPRSFWTKLSREIFGDSDIPQRISQFILKYFEKEEWKFQADQGLGYTLKKLAGGQVPARQTFVSAGERLIDPGEIVTPRHVAMLTAMKEEIKNQTNFLSPMAIGGSALMTLLFLLTAYFYLRQNQPTVYRSNRKLSLLATVLVLNLLLAKLIEIFLLKHSSDVIDLVSFPLFIPFSAILLSSLINLRIAAFGSIFLSVIFIIALAVAPTPFIVVNTVGAIVAIYTARSLRRRKEVFMVAGKVWLASLAVIFAFHLYENTAFMFTFLSDVISAFVFMGLTALLVVGLLPILEALFSILTDITLMEYMDPSNPLLHRLTIEAPGTYQHSMVVGNLAEAGASSIGANGLFCRVATLYHDIGKLANPQYFTENQMGGVDMHQLLTPLESAGVIIAHVSEGVMLARKEGLPEQFIDIIKEHHGTTIVYYFYRKQLEKMNQDHALVDMNDFRYSGPKPRSKESTLIMIADTLEAASRSLDRFTEQTVTDLVDTLVAQKAEDGQFDQSPLTFEELAIAKRVMVKTLLAASHTRIKYPPHHPGEEG